MNFSLTLVHHDYNVYYFVRKFSRYICTNSCFKAYILGLITSDMASVMHIFQCFDVLSTAYTLSYLLLPLDIITKWPTPAIAIQLI